MMNSLVQPLMTLTRPEPGFQGHPSFLSQTSR